MIANCSCTQKMIGGQCSHCDRRPAGPKAKCPSNCEWCERRSLVCPICMIEHGNPGAARTCENVCRRAEVNAARKRS